MTRVSRRKKAPAGPTPNERASAQIRAYMAARRLTSVELATITGLSQSTASRRMLGHGSFDLNQMVAIAAWLRVPLAELVDPANGYALISK
jgi:transcriptional regulator with XRE-family HTH domain